MSRLAGTALALLLASLPAHADGEIAATLRQTAQEYLMQQARSYGDDVRVEVEPPDPRLSLARCASALRAELTPGARAFGRTTVMLRCPGPQPWSVPLAARVQVLAEVLVATRPLARGVPLTPDDFLRRRQDLATATSGALTDPAQALGRRLRYPVAAGTVFTTGLLESAPLVRRGQTVTLVSGSDGFEVRATGEALADGGQGQTIRVRNRETRRVLEGAVEANGRVRLPM